MSRTVNPADRSAWESRGGRIRFDAKGRPCFIIRTQINGHRYEVSTKRHTLAAALAEWDRFERDPDRYMDRGNPKSAALYLDNDSTVKFLAWSLNEKKNTSQWVAKQKTDLAWWMQKLSGLNLRRVSLRDHIVPALEGSPNRRHRVAVIKCYFGWLRKQERVLTSAEDPTIDLTVEQAQPAQWKRSKVIPRDHIDLVVEHLVSPWRDALIIQAGTGWHTTEIVRFAASGTIEPLPRNALASDAAGVLVCPMHKSGELLRTRVSAPVVEAAKKLLEYAKKKNEERAALRDSCGDKEVGGFSREWYDRAVRAACAAVKRPDGGVGIPVFTPGRLRHSVATWAINAGADPAQVSAFLGHKSPRTTRKFYATHAAPAKVPTLR